MPEGKDQKTIAQAFPSFAWRMKPSSELFGRERELDALEEILLKKRMRNALVVGKAGVGKTEIVRHLAKRMSATHSFYEVSAPALVAGTKWRGDFEKRMTALMEAAKKESKSKGKEVVLFFDEAHLLVGAGSSEDDKGPGRGIDAANMLKPYMSDGDVVVWGATTESEASATIAADEAMSRRFALVRIGELGIAASVKAVEAFSGGAISGSLAELACEEASSIPGVHLPDSAIELADRAMARSRRSGTPVSGLSISSIAAEMRESFVAR